jgi:N-acylneuraminate cytidylyltransferase
MKTLALIPARGGSKRLPGKNLRPLAGRPLIHYSIIIAQMAGLKDIYVTTDDEQIAQTSQQAGARTIMRPAELADDHAKTVDAIKHAVDTLKAGGETFDAIMTLQPTNPLRTVAMLQKSMEIFETSGADSLLTVSQCHHKLGKLLNGSYQPVFYKIGDRSQDIEPIYYENGLIYITSPTLLEKNILISKQNQTYITDEPFGAIDIDTAEDFAFAEMVYERYKSTLTFEV